MPSGIELTGLGDESRCMVCHQGRESKISVDEAITAAAPADDDTVSGDLGFINIHYFAAAATQFGAEAEGGYQYDGMSYDPKFFHVAGYNTCIQCHNQHTLEIRIEDCKTCHTNVTSVADFVNVRMNGSLVDYDGDGNVTEGIAQEIAGLQEKLYTAIQAYGNEVSGTPIIYDAHTYPYFFIDTNGNGQVDEGEANFGNRYNAWTARLLKAAYNYQVSQKDPGKFAHNGKYIIELIYDSIMDLNSAVSTPVDMSNTHRIDAGHFAGSQEPFRHWDEEGEVSGSCSRCHSAEGLARYHKEGVNISEETTNGFKCATCHGDAVGGDWSRLTFDDVTFPSGAVLSFGEGSDSNLCATCHQGRESTDSVNKATEGMDADTVSASLRFINVHYFAAGATRFGGQARGAYQYAGKDYVGLFPHVSTLSQCTECHDAHALTVKVQTCTLCHPSVANSQANLTTIRMSTTDFDGDGDTTEGIAGEVETMADALLTAIQTYANTTAGTDPIVYDPNRYPYFFNDAGERYATWTPRLLKGAYNYQYFQKDPGGFAHNAKYLIQVLYDGIEDLGGDVSGMTRP